MPSEVALFFFFFPDRKVLYLSNAGTGRVATEEVCGQLLITVALERPFIAVSIMQPVF